MPKYLFICVILMTVCALDNGLGKTPPMGWNPWNKYGCNISEDIVKSTAQALISSGLADAGYVYINLDDCWQVRRDPNTKRIIPDPERFPSGMAELVKWVHARGLKFGLYSDAGLQTCERRPGSLGFEEIDAQTYAQWDIDYLKYDNCYHDGTSPKVRYPPMRDALMKQQKKIYFSMCEWGVENPWEWGAPVANSWRTTGDIKDNWFSFITILEMQVGLEKFSGPGAWNDPDMLEVGNGGMTTDEYQAHFALWALLKAPLLIGCDITKMSDDTKRILLNKEIIAVNQDPLGKQGRRIAFTEDDQTWVGEVVDGVVVILFNTGEENQVLSVKLSDIGISGTAQARDLVKQQDLGSVSGQYTAQVKPHACVMIKFKTNKLDEIRN